MISSLYLIFLSRTFCPFFLLNVQSIPPVQAVWFAVLYMYCTPESEMKPLPTLISHKLRKCSAFRIQHPARWYVGTALSTDLLVVSLLLPGMYMLPFMSRSY